ncbi:MAG TPA: hypothetical protein VGD29_09585 [Actinoplanes sp.]|jgi:hypothetical protein
MRVDGTQEKSLADFLQVQPALRGRIQLTTDRQRPGGITQSVATVLAEVGPAAATALGTALVTWLRHRTSNTRITVRRPDGTRLELQAQRIRGLGAQEVTQLVTQLADALTDAPAVPKKAKRSEGS